MTVSGTPPVPDEVRTLLAERHAARAARDFARADELRDRIVELGFRVVDGPDGASVEPLERSMPIPLAPHDVHSLLDDAPTVDVSVHWVVEGWPEDAARGIRAFRAHAGERTMQFVVADVTGADPVTYGEDVEVLALAADAGWGAATNAGLRRSRGRIVVSVDGSVEPDGDVMGPIEATLRDDVVGVCGPFGISTKDLREFHESHGTGQRREVDAVEGYLMAFRRDVLRDIGLFDEKFRWYRSADIELSFRLREAGYRAVVVDLPVIRHEHRMWHATAPEERARLSKRNFSRFLERFRDRTDLLVDP